MGADKSRCSSSGCTVSEFPRRVGLPAPATRTALTYVVKATPILRPLRHTTRQFRLTISGRIRRVTSSGIPAGFSTSSEAPLSDMLRMIQSIEATDPNMMDPPLMVRSLGLRRFSPMYDL
jgi:hypothetical protein